MVLTIVNKGEKTNMRIQTILKAGLIAAALALSANAVAADKHREAFKAALTETTAAADKAASVGGEWRDIRGKKGFITMAEKAAAEGNYVKAMKLLNKAKHQAEMGYQQAMEQKNAGPRF